MEAETSRISTWDTLAWDLTHLSLNLLSSLVPTAHKWLWFLARLLG